MWLPPAWFWQAPYLQDLPQRSLAARPHQGYWMPSPYQLNCDTSKVKFTLPQITPPAGSTDRVVLTPPQHPAFTEPSSAPTLIPP